MSTGARRTAEAAAWWVALTAGYLVLVSTVTTAEMVLGALLAGLATVVGILVIGPFRPDPPPRHVRWRSVLWLPVDVVRDVGATTVAVARSLAGAGHVGREEDVVLLPQADGEAESLRTYAVLLLSASPGTYVERLEQAGEHHRDRGDRARLHRLGGAARSERAVWP